MPFSGGASHHQRACAHEAAPEAANEIDHPAQLGLGTNEQIQIKEKERLDPTNFARLIADYKISVIELFVDRVLDQFVISAILGLSGERINPSFTFYRFEPRSDFDAATR
ncbi:MAG TPA: hypothetical protein VMF32_12855 [Xanthobacteraceae bacterium]|nr:hypothetical protein [Xanthobacteraceae bacterium]